MAQATQNLIDSTNVEGLTQGAIRMWGAMARAADSVGLDRINLQAGAGGGHRSHAHGTEIDVLGYNAGGSTWTTEQRLAIAMAAGAAGANRFGFYTQGAGPTSLHVGLGYEGAPSNVAWGPGGATNGVGINGFAPEERAFVAALRGGNLNSYLASEQVMAFSPEPPQEASPEAVRAVNAMAASVPSLAGIVEGGGVVRRGARGVPVEELQSFLNEQGHTDASGERLTVDGVFGPRTEQALESFQREASLGADGRLGRETFAAIRNTFAGEWVGALPEPAPAAETIVLPPGIAAIGEAVESGHWLRRGAQGDMVRQLQSFLNHEGFAGRNGSTLTVDGVFGQATRQALREFQAAHGVAVDGVLGPETLRAMQGVRIGEMQPVLGENAGQGDYQPAPFVAVDLDRQNIREGFGAIGEEQADQTALLQPLRPVRDFTTMTLGEIERAVANDDLTLNELRMAGEIYRHRREQQELDWGIAGIMPEPQQETGPGTVRSEPPPLPPSPDRTPGIPGTYAPGAPRRASTPPATPVHDPGLYRRGDSTVPPYMPPGPATQAGGTVPPGMAMSAALGLRGFMVSPRREGMPDPRSVVISRDSFYRLPYELAGQYMLPLNYGLSEMMTATQAMPGTAGPRPSWRDALRAALNAPRPAGYSPGTAPFAAANRATISLNVRQAQPAEGQGSVEWFRRIVNEATGTDTQERSAADLMAGIAARRPVEREQFPPRQPAPPPAQQSEATTRVAFAGAKPLPKRGALRSTSLRPTMRLA